MKNLIRTAKSKAFKSLILLTLGSLSTRAQIFNPTITSEVTYPTTAVGPLAVSPPPVTAYSVPIAYAQVPGLFCNAHASNTVMSPGDPPQQTDYVAETASWTVSNASGWEDGYFTYGYTDASGVYIPVGTESIPGAKHLSVAYMTDPSGLNAYVIAAYTIRRQIYDEPFPCVYVSRSHYEYGQEYRIYDWPVVTGSVSFARMGRVSNIAAGINPIYNYPACHPEYSSPYSLWGPDFAFDGNIVMDVSVDAKRVAFAWTGNGGTTQLSVANINSGTNPATLNISSPTSIAPSPGRDPLDIAFRRDPSLPSGFDPYTDFIHTLQNDGADRYYVIQDDYNSIIGAGGHTQLQDDASFIGPMLTGTSLSSGRIDQIKLDVPDVSAERRWAYTWSDGATVFLRRYVAPFSLATPSGIGSSTTQIINNGSLQDMAGNPIDLCSANRNIKVAIAYKGSSNNIFLGWLTDATIGSPTGGSGFQNAISIELTEAPAYPSPMRAVSSEDYLHVQTNNLMTAREYVALSHHSSTTNNYLYNCFTADDGMDNYLQHKNHNMSGATMWRATAPSGIEQATTIKVGPNPFMNTLQLQGDGLLEVKLNDIMGRRIASFNGTAGTINPVLSNKAAQVASGAYVLTVKDEKGREQVFKLNKQ